MNDILFILTITSVIIMPIQTLTGLYGMNFVEDGGSNMPELNWAEGYLFVIIYRIRFLYLLSINHSLLQQIELQCGWQLKNNSSH